MQVAKHVEAAFGNWAKLVWRRPYVIILLMLLFALGLASRIPLLEVDTSTENFLRSDDPVKVTYDQLREEFGRDQLLIVAIEPPNVFDLEFLRKLERVHRELEDEVPHLDQVTSLLNVRFTRGEEDSLIVGDLLEEFPQSQADLDILKERALANPFFIDRVISENGRIAIILIETQAYSSLEAEAEFDDGFDDFEGESGTDQATLEFLSGVENEEVANAVKDIIGRHEAPDFPVRIAGGVLITSELQSAMLKEMPIFFGVSLFVIGSMLLLLFRRISPVLLGLLTVVLGVVSTLGAVDLTGYKLTLSTQILPSFLLAVGISYSVHLLSIFLQQLDAIGDRREALIRSLQHTGLPILMTGITTVAGLLSFLAAELSPINELGVVGALGVGMSLTYSLVLLPALLAVLPLRPRPQKVRAAGLHDRALRACGQLAVRHPWKVILVTALLTMASIALATQVRFSSDPLAYLPPDNTFRQATYYLDDRAGGAMTLEALIDTGKENGLHDPEVLNRIEKIHERVRQFALDGLQVRRASSVIYVAKEMHQALNENRQEFYVIPQDSELLAQEFLLFENSGSEDLEKIIDSTFQKARISIRMVWQDGYKTIGTVERAKREFQEIMGDHGNVTITGMSAVITRTVGATIESMTQSYLLALILITPLMMLLIGSLRSGLVSMVPNLVPIIMTLGLMVLAGITLDMFTLMFGCIAIGLAVDDTIHFIAGFRRYLAQTGDPAQAVDQTLQTTGRALLFTSIVLTLGFSVFLFSSMANLRDFGTLTAFAIAAAFMLDVTATPALLVLVARSNKV